MLLTDFLAQYVNELRSGKRCRHRHAVPVADGTLRCFQTLYNVMINFEAEVGDKYDINNVGMAFQRQFVSWCLNRGVKCNTVRSYLTMLRTVMNCAIRENLCENIEFRYAEFIPLEEDVEVMVLSVEMVSQLMKYEFSSSRLNEARDIFIAGYLTGQRFSDYSRLSTDMYEVFDGRKFIRIIQQKTGSEVYIPLDKRVDLILRRYCGRLPEMNLSEFNLRLREIGEKMGWSGRLTSHTARRSFATNAYCAGVPMASIMCITGHTREEHLRRYLHLKADVLALQAARDLYG